MNHIVIYKSYYMMKQTVWINFKILGRSMKVCEKSDFEHYTFRSVVPQRVSQEKRNFL